MQHCGLGRQDSPADLTARAYAAQTARAENFPVALRMLPSRPRRQLTAVYRYARFVDDVGDEAAGERAAQLDAIERDVRAIPDGTPQLPVVQGLVSMVRPSTAGRVQVPLQPFLDLIEANRVDQVVHDYATFDDLLGYCRLSAAPVGRIVLHLAGAAGEANIADSDAVCAALQVLEHCQDVGEDARAGRVYLPQRDLAALGVGRAELGRSQTGPALRRAVAVQVERCTVLLAAGAPLVARLRGWSRLAVAGYVAGGWATADALRSADYEVLAATVRPSRLRTAAVAARLLMPRRPGRRERGRP